MIKEKQQLTGNLKTKQSLSSKLGNAIIYIDPITQEKTIEPSKVKQVIVPDDGFNGLSKVTVNKIDDNYIFPNGEIEINQNGTYDVKEKESAVVNIPEKILGTKSINSNGVYKATDDNLDGYSELDIDVSADFSEFFTNPILAQQYYTSSSNDIASPFLASLKKIPSNLTFTTTQNLCKGCYSLNDVSALNGIVASNSTANMFNGCQHLETVPLFDTSNVTNMSSMFNYCRRLKNIPLFDTSNVTNMSGAFKYVGGFDGAVVSIFPSLDLSKVTQLNYCFMNSYITEIPSLDTSNVTTFLQTFQSCTARKIGTIKGDKAINIQSIMLNATYLMNFGGFENLGMSYLETANANNSYYTLDLSKATKLTEQSLINILNKVYDIATKGCNTQTIKFGTTNLAKLTSTEGQAALTQAQNYGWTIS